MEPESASVQYGLEMPEFKSVMADHQKVVAENIWNNLPAENDTILISKCFYSMW